jgi:predicted metalloprotease with PDZ domain
MNQKSLLEVVPHKSFSKVSVALPEISKNKFEVQDFDTLVDSPIEIGNQDIIEFESMGVKHTIANYSVKPLNYDKKEVAADYKKVVEAAASVFGGKHPCKEYLFIVHHAEGIGGGLEHLNSTTCQTSTGAYENRDKYIGFLGLIAHEYFHLWNVKRLRPAALGHFDYENENYTNMLWVSEGFTSYYQNDILRRAGLIDEKKMLSRINEENDKLKAWAKDRGISIFEAYKMLLNENKDLVSEYGSEYYKDIASHKEMNDDNRKWFKDNMQRSPEQEASFKKIKEKRILLYKEKYGSKWQEEFNKWLGYD